MADTGVYLNDTKFRDFIVCGMPAIRYDAMAIDGWRCVCCVLTGTEVCVASPNYDDDNALKSFRLTKESRGAVYLY